MNRRYHIERPPKPDQVGHVVRAWCGHIMPINSTAYLRDNSACIKRAKICPRCKDARRLAAGVGDK
ncbi:MAG: hypothetical protein ACYSWU_18235 [Planctomycetota bacterium]|jgi:hypothetical protein